MGEIWWILAAILLLVGVNTLVWCSIGLGRLLARAVRRPRVPGSAAVGRPTSRPTARDVAILIAARNEASVIARTLASAARLVPAGQIHLVSDGSDDNTASIGRAAGVRVLELSPNRGKAGALVAALEHFAIPSRFRVVVLLDADTELAPDYLATGLPLFDDPRVVAVAGRASTSWEPTGRGLGGRLLVAYRERTYASVQLLHKFGQAAPGVNAVTIVPGFASMYRSDVISRLDIAAPGLAIEDFNMTFETHALGAGRIAFEPAAARAYTQDPDTFRDYTRQVARWNLGFWQALRRHRSRVSAFWFAVWLLVVEVVFSSAVVLALAVSGVVLALMSAVLTALAPPGAPSVDLLAQTPFAAVLLGLFCADYAVTVFAAVATRRASYLWMGLAFPLIRLVDATVCMRTLVLAITRRSDGVWASPARRRAEREPAAPERVSSEGHVAG